MQEMRAEYKLLIGLGIIFTFILLFFLLKTNYFEKISNKYKESKLVTCNEEMEEKGIEYTNYTCTINDETGKSYTISYPQIEEKNSDIKKINQILKKDFDTIYKSVKYYEEGKELELSSYQTTNFKIYHSSGIVSLLIEKKDITGDILNSVNQYQIYNIDTSTYEIIDDNDLKKKVGINRDYSSSLRSLVIKMYVENFRYNYYSELPIYRNRTIDESVESITYKAIKNLYLDDDGNIHFIMYIYNPNHGEKVPYKFTLDKNMNTTYEILNS